MLLRRVVMGLAPFPLSAFFLLAFLSMVQTAPIPAPWTSPSLPYSFDALEPVIASKIVQLHYQNHQQACTNNSNIVVKRFMSSPGMRPLTRVSPEWVLMQLKDLADENLKTAVANSVGGYYNHLLFFRTLSAPTFIEGAKEKTLATVAARSPSSSLLISRAIDNQFKSFAKFQKLYNAAAKSVFGSGWVYMSVLPEVPFEPHSSSSSKRVSYTLKITTHKNQDTPFSLDELVVPLLPLDLWEHAYYLQYYSSRDEYIMNWWNIINWETVEKKFREGTQQIAHEEL